MKIIGVTGLKNTGKTTLILKIITELKEKGYSIGTIKKTHSYFDIEGRDTEKHSSAGAELVIGSGDETFIKLNSNSDLEELITITKELKKIDFLILEGFKDSNYLKIATARYTDDETIIKTVNVEELNEEDISELVELIEKRAYGQITNLNCKKCGFETCIEFKKAKLNGNADEIDCLSDNDYTCLKINGKNVPMNPFVSELVSNIVTSMAKSLRTKEFDVEKFDTIEIKVFNED